MDAFGTGRLVYTKEEEYQWVNEEGEMESRVAKRTYYLDLGVITDISETFSKSTSTTPRTSMSAENSFVLESGNSLIINIKFERVCPAIINDNIPNYIVSREDMAYDPYANDENLQGDYIEMLPVGTDLYTLQGAMRINGSKRWSNNKWYREMTSAVDRWQMKTDGFQFMYIPDQNGDSMDNPYVPAYNYMNGYVKSLRRVYKAGSPNKIQGTIEFHVGTMHLNTSEEDTVTVLPCSNIASSAAPFINLVAIDTSTNKSFTLHSTGGTTAAGTSYLDSSMDFKISGGPNNPFECMEFSANKYSLNSIRLEGNIPASLEARMKLNLTVFASEKAGETKDIAKQSDLETWNYIIHSATVSSGSLRTKRYKVQAYCTESRLIDALVTRDIVSMDVWDVIYGLITGEFTSVILFDPIMDMNEAGFTRYVRQNVCVDGDGAPQSPYGYKSGIQISVTKGIKAWNLLQLCAQLLHAKVFFSCGHMYIVDYYKTPDGDVLTSIGDVETSQSEYRKRILGTVSDIPTSGSKFMYNYTTEGLTEDEVIEILNNEDVDGPVRTLIGRWDSIALYGAYERPPGIDEHITLDKRGYEEFRRYVLDYQGYLPTPFSISMKEISRSLSNNDSYWRVSFPPASYMTRFSDEVSGLSDLSYQPKTTLHVEKGTVNGKEVVFMRYEPSDTPRPPTLALTSYTWDMWNCSSEYIFGEVEEVSLTNELNKA